MHEVAHPADPHIEAHFESTETVRDIVIGLSDGLTVPFALAAGLSGAVTSSHIVVLAGLAEIAAGSIAMGLGGYLAAKGDAEHYASEKKREEREIVERTHDEEEEIYEIFGQYSVDRASAAPVLHALKQTLTAWVDFMMRFELGLEEPASNRAHRSALTIAASYIAGGLIPLLPYFFVQPASATESHLIPTLQSRLLGCDYPCGSRNLWSTQREIGRHRLASQRRFRPSRSGEPPLRLPTSGPVSQSPATTRAMANTPLPAILRKVFHRYGLGLDLDVFKRRQEARPGWRKGGNSLSDR